MNSYTDSPAYPPADSSCKIVYDGRSWPANFSRQSAAVHSSSAFRNPRFSERNSYTKPRIPLSVNRCKLDIPYKSELCRLFQVGKCYYGENCHYSHSTSEVRRNPELRPVAMKEHLNENRKLQECYYFSNGLHCPHGERCNFLHKCRQKVMRGDGVNREGCAISVLSERSCRNSSNQIPWGSLSAGRRDSNDKFDFRKTRLCGKWMMFGSCPYGVRCNYAHGKAELRELCFPPGLKDAEPSEVKSNIAQKLESKGRSYFNNWDIAKISQIYADN
ncbi:zinc finger CCCH-type family protein [Striga asiatica]|uniref:Zinc finger CCCH-type family protein n=1 Tax=Striga asiatica TaxID=4170 RepID=A0A5A7QU36_STRAF|nr:zinc finger CCCH-type family protein [Striga asiatica]